MDEVIASSADLLRVAGNADDVQQRANGLDIAGEAGGVGMAMPGATAATEAVSATEFLDGLSQSLSDALFQFGEAVRTAERNYDASDNSSSISFTEVTNELDDV